MRKLFLFASVFLALTARAEDALLLNGKLQEVLEATEGPRVDCASCAALETAELQSGAGLCPLFREFVKAGVPATPLRQALFYYKKHRKSFPNSRYVTLADYSQRSTKNRFYLLDLETGTFTAEQVSHGRGIKDDGDRDHDGYIDRCKRANGSRTNLTRVGFYRTAGFYTSPQSFPKFQGNYNAMRLEGLSSVNGDALSAGVVMHEAHYNRAGAVMGRSWGCPAFVPGRGGPILKRIVGGSLYYSYAPTCADDMAEVEKEIRGWEGFCPE